MTSSIAAPREEPEGPGERPAAPVCVTLGTHRQRPAFARAAVALNVFLLVREHRLTLAAVLLPDRLHWLLSRGPGRVAVVGRFRADATRRAWAAGHDGRLWRRGYREVVVAQPDGAARVARQLVVRPVVEGLAPSWRSYPWAYLHPAVGG